MKEWSGAIIVVTVLLGVAVSPVVAQAPGPTASPAPASGSAIRIAYIDVQRVLARSSAGVAAREQLEREKAVMQREMDVKRQELEKLRDELEKKGPPMFGVSDRSSSNASAVTPLGRWTISRRSSRRRSRRCSSGSSRI